MKILHFTNPIMSIVRCAQCEGLKLFVLRCDNPVCFCRDPFHLAFIVPVSSCDAVGSVSVQSTRIAFGRRAVDEHEETIESQSTNSRRETFDANAISGRQKDALCYYVFPLSITPAFITLVYCFDQIIRYRIIILYYEFCSSTRNA